MKICSLSSGSSGNCIFVASENTKILVDAGVSGRRIKEQLEAIGEQIDNIDAVLLTHEHIDHIKSAAMMVKKHNIPIYGSKGTLHKSFLCKRPPEVEETYLNRVVADNSFMIGDIEVTPFRVSHDAAEPYAYCFKNGDKKIAMATDLGMFDDYIVEHLKDAEVMYIESNHDINMLDVGRYPYPLKQRIKGDKGHLSNDSCAELIIKLCTLSSVKISQVILGHLSEENNFPELAYETVNSELKLKLPEELRPEIHVAPRNEHSFIASF